MKPIMFELCFIAAILILVPGCQQGETWPVHSMSRPQPLVIIPGGTDSDPPSDAVVLFDGTSLEKWQTGNGGPAGWKLADGYMEVVKKSGSIQTKDGFGSCQLHIEWATPATVKGDGQHPGNSGVFLMGKYEVQVLDSYGNKTYPDGQAGAVYGQNPPMVNACRPPGEWQSFDIIFHRPVFKNTRAAKPATLTVFHNGVLIQDNWHVLGPTSHKGKPRYQPHPDKMPVMLQNHGNPVRYRNIWLRELE